MKTRGRSSDSVALAAVAGLNLITTRHDGSSRITVVNLLEQAEAYKPRLLYLRGRFNGWGE
jgi:hypothetical protein